MAKEKTNKPIVAVIYGSDSDLPCMQEAIDFLDSCGVAYETTIVSAHRTPYKLIEYAKTAYDRGIRVIIAGAGGAAHLPGMVASVTPLPVIGVPIKSASLSGIDSLYSIVQMPPGIPVATMAIGGAKNAGIMAVSILGTSDKGYFDKVAKYKKELENMVEGKCKEIERLGSKEYIKKNK
ncbi:MAG: 5-(carboxyamino)imidazole ribonucleotide mutase [Firmicutes bacterium]|nr:5-(carboxyamino)imidazole ribonucleotide mutase [Bacillota bacterium]